MKPSEAATALADGTVDVVFSVPYARSRFREPPLAGSYLSDGPGFFIATESTASVVPSMTLDTLTAMQDRCTGGFGRYWKLQSEFGAEAWSAIPTLETRSTACREGKVAVVAGDALVAGYIIRDMPTVHLAGQLEPALRSV